MLCCCPYCRTFFMCCSMTAMRSTFWTSLPSSCASWCLFVHGSSSSRSSSKMGDGKKQAISTDGYTQMKGRPFPAEQTDRGIEHTPSYEGSTRNYNKCLWELYPATPFGLGYLAVYLFLHRALRSMLSSNHIVRDQATPTRGATINRRPTLTRPSYY